MLKGGGDTVLAFDLRFESAVQDRCRASHNSFRQYCLNPWIGQGQFRPSARTKSVAFKLFQPCGSEVWRFEVLDSQGVRVHKVGVLCIQGSRKPLYAKQPDWVVIVGSESSDCLSWS